MSWRVVVRPEVEQDVAGLGFKMTAVIAPVPYFRLGIGKMFMGEVRHPELVEGPLASSLPSF
jgi:hypothetical protein